MKKILILLLLSLSLAAQAQNRKVITEVFTDLAIADSTTTYTMDNSYQWAFQLVWSGGTGTLDGTVALYVSNYPTSNYILYDTYATTTLSKATGNWLFSDTNMTFQYFRVIVTKNNMTGGTLTGKLIRMKN
ncbi:MAG: hypothetical protein WC359_13410 [Dehalococcoidia bacterium]|jgi:hypothetical protein